MDKIIKSEKRKKEKTKMENVKNTKNANRSPIPYKQQCK